MLLLYDIKLVADEVLVNQAGLVLFFLLNQVLVLGRCRYMAAASSLQLYFLLKCNYLLLGMTEHQVFILSDFIKLEMYTCVLLFVSCQKILLKPFTELINILFFLFFAI